VKTSRFGKTAEYYKTNRYDVYETYVGH